MLHSSKLDVWSVFSSVPVKRASFSTVKLKELSAERHARQHSGLFAIRSAHTYTAALTGADRRQAPLRTRLCVRDLEPGVSSVRCHNGTWGYYGKL